MLRLKFCFFSVTRPDNIWRTLGTPGPITPTAKVIVNGAEDVVHFDTIVQQVGIVD